MARFQLVPPEQESAMEQLWKAARISTYVIARKHNWWHLRGKYLDEAIDRIIFATVTSFIQNKVKRKTYAYVTKDGKKLTFFDNALSSCFGCAGNVIDRYIKELDLMNRTADIEPLKFCLGYENRLPNYVSETESTVRYKKAYRPYSRLKRPCDRARRLQEAYQDYTLEAGEMGLSTVLSFDKWLGRNGYSAEEDPELFWYLLPYEEKVELHRLNRDIEYAKLPKDQKHRRDYQREYARKRREKERAEMDRKLREVLGAPPEGYQWFEMKSGKVGQRRLKK